MTLTSSLRDRVFGPVVAPKEAEYEDARRFYNFVIDKHPAVIVRCTGARDVQAVVAHGLSCRSTTSAEHQPATVVAHGIEWPPALVAAAGG